MLVVENLENIGKEKAEKAKLPIISQLSDNFDVTSVYFPYLWSLLNLHTYSSIWHMIAIR